jgi:hypothetical protein
VRDHRTNLKALYDAMGLTLPDIAKQMGWKSPRTVAMKLDGKRDWKSGELERMCKIAGTTLVRLAEISSDLQPTKHKEALKAASLVDRIDDPELRAKAIKELEHLIDRLKK